MWPTFILIAALSSGVTNVISAEDEGPQHDSAIGDYELNSKRFPHEEDPPDPSPEECARRKNILEPNINLSVNEFIRKYNYTVEDHEVLTEDGHYLTVHRITGSSISPPAKGKIPVYLNHGLAGNSWSWLFHIDNRSLAFKLANEGFDVFISNARGSKLSLKHKTFNYIKQEENFWDWSFHELGIYDVPAVIDYIINVTNFSSIYYVGHSLGTMQYLICMSERPEYGSKIRVGFLLATAAYIHTIRSVALRGFITSFATSDLKLDTSTLEKICLTCILQVPPPETSLNVQNTSRGYKSVYKPFPINADSIQDQANLLTNVTCTLDNSCGGACDQLLVRLFGFNPRQNDPASSAFFNAKYFSSTSSKVFAHLAHNLLNERFAKFDYGKKNMEAYGQDTPPNYPLEKINATTVSFWGYTDHVTVPEDVRTTYSKFSPGVLKENNRVMIKSFAHLDFLIANEVEKYVTNRLVWIMKTGKYVETK